MKPGDTIMIFTGNVEEGKAKLIELVKDFGECQQWKVEFEDYPERYFLRMIKT